MRAMTLVNGTTVHPSLFELGARRYLTVAANCALDAWAYDGLDESPAAAGGGSVATTAFSVATRWRCSPIVMVGLDLSFPGGRYYVETGCDGDARAVPADDGSVRVEGWSDRFRAMKAGGGPGAAQERGVTLPGWHGEPVPSGFMFSMFHRWFVETCRRLPDGVHAINCTEGGAFIEGMAHRRLAEVVAELPLLIAPVDDVLAGVVAGIDGPRRVAQVRARSAVQARRLVRCGTLAARCRVLAKRAGHDAGAEAALRRAEGKLVAALRGLEFVAMIAQREIAAAILAARCATDADEALAASRVLFDAVIATAREIGPLLQQAAGTTRSSSVVALDAAP